VALEVFRGRNGVDDRLHVRNIADCYVVCNSNMLY
jgi:hypothetical protein